MYDAISHRDTYDAQRLAQTLHVPGQEVAKTVLLRAEGGDTYFVCVLPATKTIDFEKVSAALGGSRVELATEIEIMRHCPDCELGALPPFGSQYGMPGAVGWNINKPSCGPNFLWSRFFASSICSKYFLSRWLLGNSAP